MSKIAIPLLLLATISILAYWVLFAGKTFAGSAQYRSEQSARVVEKLGKELFFDKNLSNPKGVSCASCHDPESGYAGSPHSEVNALLGTMPGAIAGRFENRNPQTISYAKFTPEGPPIYDPQAQTYIGGLFWDGRARGLVDQVHFPLFHPNEMNNLVNGKPAPILIVKKVRSAPYARLFKQVYGNDVFGKPTESIFKLIAQAIVAFELSDEVSPFSSKYDAYLAGQAELTTSELNGLKLATGSLTGRPGGQLGKSAQCILCHEIPSDRSTGPDLWTRYCFANTGVPKNMNNPYYRETNKNANPQGYNPFGTEYVDLGLGGFIYPARSLPSGNTCHGANVQGDFLLANGNFKVPTLRNVDKRLNATFVKAYMHNGVFKSLKEVVHFYNTRNRTTEPGEVIDFTNPHPYADLKGKPLWPPPENPWPDTLQDAEGIPGLIGNLCLTEEEENDIVAFLKTLSDGYIKQK